MWIVSRCDPYKDQIPKIPAETLIEFSNKYVALFEQLTGLKFEKPDPRVSVRARIRDALAKELPEYF